MHRSAVAFSDGLGMQHGQNSGEINKLNIMEKLGRKACPPVLSCSPTVACYNDRGLNEQDSFKLRNSHLKF